MINNINPTDKLVFDLEMFQYEYNEEKKNNLKKKISEKYNIPQKNIDINFIPKNIDNNGEKISLTSGIIENIQIPEFQLELFKEYLKLKGIENIDFKDIEAIDKQVNAFIDFDQYSAYKTYKFKYVKWKNYLSYGPDNYFDFTKLHGLVLLNGYPENQCGKTTFAIDLLRFALFGKAQKCPTLDSVFNVYLPKETEVIVEACIEIDGNDYIIRRTVTRPKLEKRTEKSKCKQTLEYFKIVNGNLELIENCEGENNQETNNIIKESVGTVEDFNLVISATSYTLGDLLRMGQTDKGKLFSRWLGLLTIEKKEEVAKKLWRDYSSKLYSNNYSRSVIENEIKDYETVNASYNKEIVNKDSEVNKINEELEKIQKEKYDSVTRKKEIKDELIKLDVTTIENNIKIENNNLFIKKERIESLNTRYQEIKNIIYNDNEYRALIQNIKTNENNKNALINDNTELKTKILYINNEINKIKELIDNKICPNCHQEVSVEQQNKRGLELYNEKQILIKQGVINKGKIDSLILNNEELEKKKVDMENNRELLNEKQRLELEMTAIKSNIDTINLNLHELERKKKEIETNKENIRLNNEIDLTIRNLDIQYNEKNKSKELFINEVQSYKLEIKNNLNEIDKRNKIITIITEEEKTIKNWNIYQELVGKNGIIKIVLKRALPIINNEIARMLNGLCDFEVKLDIDSKNNVTINMERDGKILDLATSGSGFEGTFASLALRSALSNIGNMPKPSFLCLDEVDSTIASTNYDKLTELYRRILNGYDFIIHIVHNPELETIHDMTITVVKENNISKIELK